MPPIVRSALDMSRRYRHRSRYGEWNVMESFDGQTISHFHVLEKIGGGGMGVVYLAENLKLKSKVALKFLPLHLAIDQEAKQRFVQEATMSEALRRLQAQGGDAEAALRQAIGMIEHGLCD